MEREKVFPIYPDEAKTLKAMIYDFSEISLRQALWGMVNILTFRTSITKAQFKEILDDANRYSSVKKQP